jgi:HlyD family secretion protein
VQIEIGIADNAFVEVLGGDLQEGDQVIVGGGPQPQEQQRDRGPIGGPSMRIRGA